MKATMIKLGVSPHDCFERKVGCIVTINIESSLNCSLLAQHLRIIVYVVCILLVNPYMYIYMNILLAHNNNIIHANLLCVCTCKPYSFCICSNLQDMKKKLIDSVPELRMKLEEEKRRESTSSVFSSVSSEHSMGYRSDSFTGQCIGRQSRDRDDELVYTREIVSVRKLCTPLAYSIIICT